MLSKKIITIFGGSGFIGSRLSHRLASANVDVRVVTRSVKPINQPTAHIQQLVYPTLDETSIMKAADDADTVINLIGILYETSRQTFQDIHVNLADRIARVAKKNGTVNFVQMSALGADSQSQAIYARTKAAGENAVRRYFPNAIIIRPSIVFGAEDNFFNLFAKMVKFSPVLPLIGGGHSKFQPVFVDDVAEAITRSLDLPNMQGQILELGGPSIYTFRQLLELLLKTLNKKRILIPLPWALANIEAMLLELLPHPLLTRDQIKLLQTDNVILNNQSKTFHDLGITPANVESIIPTYLK